MPTDADGTTDHPTASGLRAGSVRVLVTLSGAALLAYEVVGARDFALVYGSTAMGTAVVVAAVFAGLSLGASLGGRWPARAPSLRRYAGLEMALAIAALVYLLV